MCKEVIHRYVDNFVDSVDILYIITKEGFSKLLNPSLS